MNFDLSEEQEAIAATVRHILAKEIDGARRLDALSSTNDHDVLLWKSLVGCGVAGIVAPESRGGSGLGLLEAALVAQEIGGAAAPVPYWGHTLACLAIAAGGTDEQRARWLPGLATGELLGTVALAERGGHWLPSEWELVTGDALHGSKVFVPNVAAADLFVVGLAGGSLAVVEAGPRLQTTPVAGSDRTRNGGEVKFAGVLAEVLPAADAEAVVDAGLVLLAADAFGGAEACLERSVEYSLTREQYGVPIGSFQAVKHQLADVAVELEQSRALWWYAAHAWDALPHARLRAAMLAKMHLADLYVRASRTAVEVHGGLGFTWDFDLHVWVRRAVYDQAFLCDSRRLRQLLAADAGWCDPRDEGVPVRFESINRSEVQEWK